MDTLRNVLLSLALQEKAGDEKKKNFNVRIVENDVCKNEYEKSCEEVMRTAQAALLPAQPSARSDAQQAAQTLGVRGSLRRITSLLPPKRRDL